MVYYALYIVEWEGRYSIQNRFNPMYNYIYRLCTPATYLFHMYTIISYTYFCCSTAGLKFRKNKNKKKIGASEKILFNRTVGAVEVTIMLRRMSGGKLESVLMTGNETSGAREPR